MHPRASSWGRGSKGSSRIRKMRGGGGGGGGKKDDEAVEAMTKRGSGAEGEGPDGDGGCR